MVHVCTTSSLSIPLVYIFFNFFQQCLFIIPKCISLSPSLLIPKYFVLFDIIFNIKIEYNFLNFLFEYFIVYKSNWSLHVNLVSFNFDEFISSNSFLGNLYHFVHIRSCNLQTEIILFFLCNLDVFQFFFLPNCSGQYVQYYFEQNWKKLALLSCS